MDELSLPEPLPPSLRLLKALVIVLLVTMIAGVIAVVWLLVTRMPDYRTPDWPETLALPAGAVPEAVTKGQGWTAIVTQDGRILIFDAKGKMTQEIPVTKP